MTWYPVMMVTCQHVPCTANVYVRDDGAPAFVVQELLAHGWQYSNVDGEDRCPDHHRPLD